MLSENFVPPGGSGAPANCPTPLHLPSPTSSWDLHGAKVPTIHMMIFFSLLNIVFKFSYKNIFLNTMYSYYLIFSMIATLCLFMGLVSVLLYKFSMENFVYSGV